MFIKSRERSLFSAANTSTTSPTEELSLLLGSTRSTTQENKQNNENNNNKKNTDDESTLILVHDEECNKDHGNNDNNYYNTRRIKQEYISPAAEVSGDDDTTTMTTPQDKKFLPKSSSSWCCNDLNCNNCLCIISTSSHRRYIGARSRFLTIVLLIVQMLVLMILFYYAGPRNVFFYNNIHPRNGDYHDESTSHDEEDEKSAQHFDHKNDPTTNSNDNPKSWLDHIQLGEWIGSGGWSDAFEAIIDKDYNPYNKSYIIKFTGDIAKDGDVDHAKSSITAAEVIKRLSPHPSIPENLYFVAKIPNPFHERFQIPNTTRPMSQTTGGEKMNRKRLTTSKYMSIQVSEKVTQTHDHTGGYMPGDKLRCFLYHFFQVLDYAHSKNIMMIDLILYNVILQDGVIKFIDWSDAMIFETQQEQTERMRNNSTYPYAFCTAGGMCSDGKKLGFRQVHEYDVQKLGGRIKGLLRHYKVKDIDDYDTLSDKQKADDKGYYFISTRDHKLITNMTDKMLKDKPAPKLEW
eukprot:CAMPEP_0176478598 /NCGR_PEP_ID=MMETSP0200_2-20121128/1271_1 /TAXON_ID=947934 /ORGANISM="Chaetoceros sp., Strain GSL56" /LENGTH=517 /DNA_ID=CAMNT_0017874545 /DNA_START=247 /DNA_END=1797 /DNA_ORIENTATION=+